MHCLPDIHVEGRVVAGNCVHMLAHAFPFLLALVALSPPALFLFLQQLAASYCEFPSIELS